MCSVVLSGHPFHTLLRKYFLNSTIFALIGIRPKKYNSTPLWTVGRQGSRGVFHSLSGEYVSISHCGSFHTFSQVPHSNRLQCGYITDVVKTRSFVHRLLLLSSVLTLICYAWLALPPTATSTPLPAMISFGLGIGFSPRL